MLGSFATRLVVDTLPQAVGDLGLFLPRVVTPSL